MLPDRDAKVVADYKIRQANTFEMIRASQPWLNRLAAWPHANGMAICNSLSFLNAHPGSDIDVFVMVEPKKLWSTRFVLVSLLHLFGKRPTSSDQAGKICLSFFINAQNPDIHGMALADDDVYLSYWSKLLLPMHDNGGAFSHFYQTNQSILKKITRGMPRSKLSAASRPASRAWRVFFSAFALLTGSIEAHLKRWQERRFPAEIKNMAGEGSSVIISDDVLKFHTRDRREEYRQAWINRYKGFINTVPAPSASEIVRVAASV